MDKISVIIGKRLNQHHLGESARASAILHKANAFLQGRLQCTESEVSAFRLKDGILYIGTAGSAWSQEVFHRQEELMDAVRTEPGQKAILKIVIKGLTT
jgi:hypothetical protein